MKIKKKKNVDTLDTFIWFVGGNSNFEFWCWMVNVDIDADVDRCIKERESYLNLGHSVYYVLLFFGLV